MKDNYILCVPFCICVCVYWCVCVCVYVCEGGCMCVCVKGRRGGGEEYIAVVCSVLHVFTPFCRYTKKGTLKLRHCFK